MWLRLSVSTCRSVEPGALVSDLIVVEPAPGLRVEFARWGSDFQPGFRTCSHAEFEVPASLLSEVPEELLIGALVDGHRYRSPVEDEANGTPPPGVPVPGSVFVQEAGLVPGSWPGPEEVPVFAPLEDAPADEPEPFVEPAAEGGPEVWPCDGCERTFGTQRGLNKHRNAAHGEGA